MKFRRIIYLTLVVPMLFAACKRDHNFGGKNGLGDEPTASINITDPDKLIIPESFNFETTKNLEVYVKVSNFSYPGELFRINVYIDEPSTGKLTTAGMTDDNGEYYTPVRVARDLEYIYIEKVDNLGNRVQEKVQANLFVKTLFTDGVKKAPYNFRKASSGIDCNTGCTQSYNNHTGNIIINSGEIACVTGTYSGNITLNGTGILKFCGTGTIDSLVLNSTARAYILDDAVATVGRIISNSSSTEFTNWSDSLISNHCATANSIAENHGKFYIQCSLTVSSTGTFNNFGELYVTGHVENSGELTNYHYINVNDYVTVNTGGKLNNYCNFTAKSNFTLNGDLSSNSYTKVAGTMLINSGAKATLSQKAYLSTTNLTNYGQIKTTGSATNIIKVTGVSNLASGSSIAAKIQLCDANGVEVNNGTFLGSLSCGGYLATSLCNIEGFGSYVVPDADGDGIADVLDDYPNDATRAFNQFYPCATTCSNFAFEDLWPSKGDYDYNDHVVAYNLQKVFSPDRKIVDFKLKIKPRAVGAGMQNGLGFSLDNVPPSAVLNVTGQVLTTGKISLNANKTEANQSHAVIIAYDTPEPFLHRGGGSMFNTIQDNPRGASDTSYIGVTFLSKLADSLVPFTEFNPFLIANCPNTRGIEIHLPNRKPTDLANQSLFGTSADASNPATGRYYKTAQGMPWAIEIPEDFNYPQEKISILNCYNYFDDWAASGGTAYPNWFRNFGAYVDNTKLFRF